MLTALATWFERKFLGLVFVDVFPGPFDDRRLGIFLLDENLIAQYGEVLGKNGQQFDGGFVLFPGNDFAGKISFAQGLAVYIQSPLLHLFFRPFKLGLGRFFTEQLPGLEKANQPVAQPDRHGRVAKSGSAGHRLRLGRGLGAKPFLHLQTGGASPALL